MKKRWMLILGLLVISLLLVGCGKVLVGKAGDTPLLIDVSAFEITPTSATLSATTNEMATCMYSTSDIEYVDMISFGTTGTTSHSTSLVDLSSGTMYTYYVKCQDMVGNIGSTSTSFITLSAAGGGGGGGGGAVVPDGDVILTPLEYENSFLISTSSNNLEMANSDSTAGTITGEQISDIKTHITKSELDILADGAFNAKSYVDYSQYLYFDTTNTDTNEIVKYAESDDDVTNVFFYVDSGKNIGKYKLEFSPYAESSVYNVRGTVATSGPVLVDFEETKLTLLGQEYTIVLARRPHWIPEDSIKLTLLGGAVDGRLDEGEEVSYIINGKEYAVELTYVDDTYTEFKVNGEITRKLQEAEIYQLADGTLIGVSKIFYQNFAEGIRRADFFLGANKLVLRDQDITDTISSHNLEVDGEVINGANVIITGTDDNTTFRLNTIEINMNAEDDYFVGAGDTLSNAIASAGDDRRVLFTNNWDIRFGGLTEETTHEIKLNSSTDRKYNLVWYDGDGHKVSMPLAYAYDDANIILSEEWDYQAVILKESVPIKKNDYFVVTGGDPEEGTAKSYALQYKGADKVSATEPKIKFKNLGGGETLEYSVDTDNTDDVCYIELGGFTFFVEVENDNASLKNIKDFNILVDLDTTHKTTAAEPITGFLLEGETRTYFLGDKEYVVSLTYVDGEEVKFTVNGESTGRLPEEETYTLNDGNEIEVLSILYQSYAGGLHGVDFKIIEDASHMGIRKEDQVPIIDSYGAQITLDLDNYDYSAPLDSVDLTISTPNPNDYEDVEPAAIELTIDATSTNEVTVSDVTVNGITNPLLTPEGESNIAYGYTSMGGKLTYATPFTSPNLFTYEYSENQRLPLVYVLSGIMEEVIIEEETCEVNWVLEKEWSECMDGVQYKNYYDANSCNQSEVMPVQPAPINQLCDDGLSGYICPTYSEGIIVVHEINLTKQNAVPDNTYENGWEFNFFITVPENENSISMWIDDWVNDDTGDILQTGGNVKINRASGDYAVGNAHDYSSSSPFVAVDEHPSCPGRQITFDVLVKLPEDSPFGYYSTSYGIRSLRPLE